MRVALRDMSVRKPPEGTMTEIRKEPVVRRGYLVHILDMADTALLKNLQAVPEFHYFLPMLNLTKSDDVRQVVESLSLHRGLVTLCWTS
jgi:hypothetical protein